MYKEHLLFGPISAIKVGSSDAHSQRLRKKRFKKPSYEKVCT